MPTLSPVDVPGGAVRMAGIVELEPTPGGTIVAARTALKPTAGCLQFAQGSPCNVGEVTATSGVAPALIGELQGEGAQLGG
jgi:hypothetical protein